MSITLGTSSPKSDRHSDRRKSSPNNINMPPKEKVIRINKVIIKGKML